MHRAFRSTISASSVSTPASSSASIVLRPLHLDRLYVIGTHDSYFRRKTDSIIRRAGFDLSSHSGKALVNVLETYPRDELFQTDEDSLYRFARDVLQLDERRAYASAAL